jgi:ATP-binding cassette, subfamily B, bacterial PglK
MNKLRFLLKDLWRHISPRRRIQLALLLVLMVFASLAEAISIGSVLPFLGVLMSPEKVFLSPLSQPIISVLGLTEPRQLLMPLTAAFILASMISGAMRFVLLWIQTRLGFAIGSDFSFQIYKKTLYQPYYVHVGRNSSQVITGILTKTSTVIFSCLLPLLFIASSLLILATILVALIVIDPIVAVSVFGGFGAIYSFIVLLTKKRLLDDSFRINRESNQVTKALQEGLGGIRDVLIDGTQATYCKIYRNADVLLRKSMASIQVIGNAPRFFVEPLGIALISVLAYELARGEAGLAGAIPVLGALAIGAQRMLPILQQLYNSWTGIRGGQVALEDVLALLDQPLPSYLESPQCLSLPFEGTIRLNQVDFQYDEEMPLVLHEIDFEIPKGGRIGFMGTTGSGKSTLLDIIMGLLQPKNGTLTVDGVAITADNSRAWQARIAHVPQDIFLADATIAENIAFGVESKNIDFDLVRSAAQQAQIASVIESWPLQYGTITGERGVRLSGGQRQRIGIARAFYKGADVIAFDEATSALDSETELAVMEAVDRIGENITILIVAHRLSTLSNCDQLVELANGRILRVGTYEQIVNHKSKVVSI